MIGAQNKMIDIWKFRAHFVDKTRWALLFSTAGDIPRETGAMLEHGASELAYLRLDHDSYGSSVELKIVDITYWTERQL